MILDLNNFTLWNIASWLVFGLIIGSIVHVIYPGDAKGGILGAIVLGILGALVGGYLANYIFGINLTGFSIQSLAIAIIGALILTFLGKLIFRESKHIKTTTGRI